MVGRRMRIHDFCCSSPAALLPSVRSLPPLPAPYCPPENFAAPCDPVRASRILRPAPPAHPGARLSSMTRALFSQHTAAACPGPQPSWRPPWLGLPVAGRPGPHPPKRAAGHRSSSATTTDTSAIAAVCRVSVDRDSLPRGTSEASRGIGLGGRLGPPMRCRVLVARSLGQSRPAAECRCDAGDAAEFDAAQRNPFSVGWRQGWGGPSEVPGRERSCTLRLHGLPRSPKPCLVYLVR